MKWAKTCLAGLVVPPPADVVREVVGAGDGPGPVELAARAVGAADEAIDVGTADMGDAALDGGGAAPELDCDQSVKAILVDDGAGFSTHGTPYPGQIDPTKLCEGLTT